MIKKIKRIHTLLFLSILLVLLAGLIIFLKRDFLIQAYSESIFSRQVVNGSKANLWVQGNRLKIVFDIQDEDRERVKSFSQNLGVSEEYLKGVELELDSKSLETLGEVTPVEVNLEFSERGVKFANKSLKGLKSGLIKSDVSISTGSGKFDLKAGSGSNFNLKVEDPMRVIEQASASGNLSLSKKISPVFPILERVDTIEIQVSGKSVNGEIRIKNYQ